MNTTAYENETRELTIDELAAVHGSGLASLWNSVLNSQPTYSELPYARNNEITRAW
jgi:hypothetical protein